MSYFEIINSERRRHEAMQELMKVPIKEGLPIYEVTIRKYKKLRTVRQNRLYWMWLEIIGDHFGYEKEEMALTLRGSILGYDTVTLKGQAYLVPISSSGLNTKEFTDFLDRIYTFATSEGIRLPVPRDYDFIAGEVCPSKPAQNDEQKTLSIGYDPQTGELE